MSEPTITHRPLKATPSLSAAVDAALVAGERRRRRQFMIMATMVGVLVLTATVGMSIGAVPVPVGQVWSIIWQHSTQSASAATDLGVDSIIWQIRFPRVVLGALIGAGLAVLGVVVQAMVRNPLADPYILGVESGASAGAVAVIFYGGAFSSNVITPTVGGFLGAMGTLFLVFALARSNGRVSAVRLLLVGVSLSYALAGFTSFVLYSTRDPAAQGAVLFWILGGLGGAEWERIPVVVGALAIGLGCIWYYARPLNALAVGDESASALGIDPDKLRVRLFVICSLVVATIVANVGPIGFVGLVVPHVARLLIGADHRRVILASFLLGATYLVAVDIVARTIFAPSEIPIGVVTAMLGTPFFLWLIRRRGAAALKEAA
jgi:iron complex transport system permease protein